MPRDEVFNTFWHGAALSPLHWACLSSFIDCGHKVRVFSYSAIAVPAGVVVEDARLILPESELFENQGSYSAFSNIFRYTLLLEHGGWWVDTDVFCLKKEIPSCRYAWANEAGDFINGAILKFPARDSGLEAILLAARRVGRNVEVQGQLGPRLLTAHLTGRDEAEHFGSTSQFYPVHWLEAHRLWTPYDREFVAARTAGACFLHLWAMMFRYLSIDQRYAPPPGSFLRDIYARASCLDDLPLLDHDQFRRTVTSIESFLSADWARGQSQRILGYDVSGFRLRQSPDREPSVSVVIPTYDMAHCIERAIASCSAQTCRPTSIIVVDDASADGTRHMVETLARTDARIRYVRLLRNGGHLSALRHGLRLSTTDWTILLDADDELTPDSIERRLQAAEGYHARTGEWPQLVYGDIYRNGTAPELRTRYKPLDGRAFAFLARELSLCQTSTIMLGRDAIDHLPTVDNCYNTDDEIVLAIGKHFPLAYAVAPVAIAHDHATATRMTNSAWRRLRGLVQLVGNHRGEIIREHGGRRLFFWCLRVLRAFAEWQHDWVERWIAAAAGSGRAKLFGKPLRLYGQASRYMYRRLTSFLQPRFEQMYF